MRPTFARLLAISTIISIAACALPASAKGPKSIEKKPPQAAAESFSTYANHPAASLFAEDVAHRRGLDADSVRTLLAQARKLPQAQKLILPPKKASAKNWVAYRARFIEPVRLKAGQAFQTCNNTSW